MEKVLVHNITKKFGNFTAVDRVSFTVNEGEIFGLLGPNGAGKSTTIKMLCGLITPDEGIGTVGNFDIRTQQWDIKRIIGYMSQKFSLYEDLTIEENLTFYGTVYGLSPAKLKQRLQFVYELVNITRYRDSLVKNLPLGIKQRLSLAAALLHDPEILFLDEPTSGVDPLMRRIFWDEIYALAHQGKTIFVTTHYMDEAEHCNRIAFIIAGKIFALDTPQMLKETFPYTIVNVVTDSYLKAYNILKESDFIIEVALFGTDLHAILEKKSIRLSAIKNLLTSHGIHAKVETILPSLEDVFVMSARVV